LLAALGDLTEEHNGSFRLRRNGHSLALHAPEHKDVASVDDLLTIRRFLEQSENPIAANDVAAGIQVVVVIDHHEAKIYRTASRGSVPQHLVPYDPHGFGRHLRSDTEETDGKRKPERKSFYEAVASTLRGVDRILIFGSGVGESSAMEHLIADLKHNHSDVAAHVVGAVVLDTHHITEDEMLAKARKAFA
jgi:hypothetical protein